MKRRNVVLMISIPLMMMSALVSPLQANDLQTCGYHDVPLVMELLPAGSEPWSTSNNDHMWLWNQYMDIYRTEPSDGSVGNNSDNEFAGWMTSDDLFDEYGVHWSGELAATMIVWSAGGTCSRIRESDIVFNPAYTWTTDRLNAEDNPDTVKYYDSALLHEMGHSWGYQTGGTEDYDYDEPTVMHSYNRYSIQEYMTIHAPDAYHIRRNYDDQISIPTLENMVVVSKYADLVAGTWYNTYTDKENYYAGDTLSVFKLTVENTGTVDCTDVHVRLYLSTDRSIGVTDVLIGDWAWANFAAETYDAFNFTDLTIPLDTPAGTYNVGALVTVNGYGSDDLHWDDTTHIWNTVDVSRRSLEVTEPNGGEVWYTGSNYAVRWASVAGGDHVKIELSRDGGSTWETISASTSNDGTYFWYPSGPVSASCLVRISSIDHPWLVDTSDGHFSIAERMIYVTNPNDPLVWVTGSLQNITWTSTGVPDTSNIRIELTRDGGTTWELLAGSTPNDGVYRWMVTGPASSQCRVLISNAVYMVEDMSNADFTIADPYVTVTSPNGGENLLVGSAIPITWHSLGAGSHVKIDVSRDGGSTWEEIDGFAENLGTYPWSVTGPASKTCRIKVTGLGLIPVTDTSNADFSISDRGLMITSPNGGESFLVGTAMPITWDSLGAGANVSIKLSRNGGDTWEEIDGYTPNDGSYNWTVTGPVSTTCRVKITGSSIIPVTDTSDADFTIAEPTITVTSPNGGEVWIDRERQRINWSAYYVKGDVKIEITRNGGATWSVIEDAVPAKDESYLWRVSGPGSDLCAVRISSVIAPRILDTSDGPFIISTCRYDINDDGAVDEDDLEILASELGRTDCGPTIPCGADFAPDGDVDGWDLSRLISEFLETGCH